MIHDDIIMALKAMIQRREGEPVVGQGREQSTAGNSEPSPAGQALNNQFQNGSKLTYFCQDILFLLVRHYFQSRLDNPAKGMTGAFKILALPKNYHLLASLQDQSCPSSWLLFVPLVDRILSSRRQNIVIWKIKYFHLVDKILLSGIGR